MADNGSLLLRWKDDPSDDVGLLHCEAAAGGFSGCGRAWLDRETLAQFAEGCLPYPLDATSPFPELDGGYGPRADGSGARVTSLGIRVYPVGLLGQVGLRIQLATWISDSPPTRPDAHCAVRLEVLTTYHQLRQFAEALGRAVRLGEGDAYLTEDVLT